MKAWTIEAYGGPDKLALRDAAEPTVGPRDVLIEVRAASLNPIDFKLRDGKVKLVLRVKMPLTLGCDVAGVVRSVGAEVKRFAPGDEVFARLEKDRMGALAERVAADESVVATKPAGLSFEEAASIPLAGLTALQALRDEAGLKSGQRVLVHAGAGGVGSLAIQIAKALGLWVATTTSTKNVDFVKGLGADEVVDYTKGDAAESVRGLDAVFDTLGDESEVKSFAMVKPGGVVVGVSGTPDAKFAREWLPFFAAPVVWFRARARRAAASRAGARYSYLFMRPSGKELEELSAWVSEGKLRPVLHRVYDFGEAREAFAELEKGRARGKIVVRGPAPA